MFASLNVPELITKVRLLSDKRGSNFVNDAEITSLLEDSFNMLFMELVRQDEGYYLKQSEPITPQDDNIAFPNDLFKIKLLERLSGSYTYPVYQKTLAEVSGVDSPYFDYSYDLPVPFGYVVFADKLQLYPKGVGDGGFKYRLSYFRDPMTIQNDVLELAWTRYLTYKTAYTVSVIADNPRTMLADLALEWQNNIKAFASNRTTGPRVIADLEHRHGFWHGGTGGF